jgi:hypothetical protein
MIADSAVNGCLEGDEAVSNMQFANAFIHGSIRPIGETRSLA